MRRGSRSGSACRSEIRENLGQIYERWDGKGLPRGLSGNAVKFPVRLVTLAQDAIALNDHHGFETMKAMIAKRAGGGYEPELADLFLAHAEALLAGLDGPVDRETILALEPEPHAMLDEEACEEAYLAIADMIDMRMPFTFGHSRAVAALADAAAQAAWVFPPPTFATSAGRPTRTTSASWRFRSRPGCEPAR